MPFSDMPVTPTERRQIWRSVGFVLLVGAGAGSAVSLLYAVVGR